jgi:hypothetical protein
VLALFVVIAATLVIALAVSQSDASPPRPASAQGLRFWSGGDSMSYYISVGLRRRLDTEGAVFLQEEPEYVGGSGLLSTDFFDWDGELRSNVIAQDPDMLVFMIGANDANYFTPEDYMARVGSLMDAMKRDGRFVVWIGQPNMADAAYAANVQALNDVVEAEASKREWVRYVDLWDASSDADGDYTAYATTSDGTEVLARDDDGIHVTAEGGDAFAQIVFDAVFGR